MFSKLYQKALLVNSQLLPFTIYIKLYKLPTKWQIKPMYASSAASVH